MEDSSNSEAEESSSEILKEDNIEKSSNRVDSIKKTVVDVEGETYSDSEIEDDSCLQFLNPWLKTDH